MAAVQSVAKSARGKAPAGTPDIISVVHGFLKEEIPPTATGTVSQFLADYLKKCTEGGGGAAGSSTPPKARAAGGSSPSKPAAGGPTDARASGSSAGNATFS